MQREYEQRTTFRCSRRHLLADLTKECRNRSRAADHDRDVLLSVDRVGHRTGANTGAEVLLPQHLAILGIDRPEVAMQVAGEHQITTGGQRATIERQVFLDAPDLLLLDRIPGNEFTEISARAFLGREFSTEVEHAALVRDITDRPVHADVVGRHIDEAGSRIIRHRLPVLAADQVWTDVLCRMARAGTLVGIFNRAHGLDVPRLRPVGRRHEFLRRQNLAILAIGNEEESVTISLHQGRHGFSIDFQIGEDVLVDAIIVPGIGRCGLDVPLDLAGVRIERQRG